jgi:DNA adenine methylase
VERTGRIGPSPPVQPVPARRSAVAIPQRRATPAPPRHTTPRRGEGNRARPFLKWAGGKTQVLDALIARSPRQIDTYAEPFVGGGAMFFGLLAHPDLAPRRAILNDLNADLMAVYTTVRDEVEKLVGRLEHLAAPYLASPDEERAKLYYAERERLPDDRVDLAARFIFLNKTCFNGLYRVNRRGEFNVPHGKYRTPRILDEDALRSASLALQGVELLAEDFEATMRRAKPGDFVYLDPPFEPLSRTSSFTGYTEGAFGRHEQLRLKWAMDDLTSRGVRAMLSNSPADFIEGLYRADRDRYRIDRTPARRAINSRGDRRGAIDELIVLNYPAEDERRALESATR